MARWPTAGGTWRGGSVTTHGVTRLEFWAGTRLRGGDSIGESQPARRTSCDNYFLELQRATPLDKVTMTGLLSDRYDLT